MRKMTELLLFYGFYLLLVGLPIYLTVYTVLNKEEMVLLTFPIFGLVFSIVFLWDKTGWKEYREAHLKNLDKKVHRKFKEKMGDGLEEASKRYTEKWGEVGKSIFLLERIREVNQYKPSRKTCYETNFVAEEIMGVIGMVKKEAKDPVITHLLLSQFEAFELILKAMYECEKREFWSEEAKEQISVLVDPFVEALRARVDELLQEKKMNLMNEVKKGETVQQTEEQMFLSDLRKKVNQERKIQEKMLSREKLEESKQLFVKFK